MQNKEYSDFYTKNIAPYIKEFETIRKNYLFLYFSVYALLLIFFFLLFGSVNKFIQNGVINDSALCPRVFIFLYLVILIHPCACMLITRYRSVIKEKFLNNLLTKLYGLTYYNANPTVWTNIAASFGMDDLMVKHHINVEELQNLSAASGCTFSFDDFIKGAYQGIEVEMQELSFRKSTGKSSVICWHGLVMSMDLKKELNSKIIFYSDKEMSQRCTNAGLERVFSEDIEFNELFDVYSTDQIEARYIFNPVFMEKMKSIVRNNPEYKINGEFYNKKLYVLISSGKNWFEIPFFKSANNPAVYYQPVNDLKNLLSIIDVIKLNQNIGM